MKNGGDMEKGIFTMPSRSVALKGAISSKHSE